MFIPCRLPAPPVSPSPMLDLALPSYLIDSFYETAALTTLPSHVGIHRLIVGLRVGSSRIGLNRPNPRGCEEPDVK